MRFSPRAGDATIFKKIASPSQAKNRSCSRGFSDLYETNGKFKGIKKHLRSNLSPIDHYLLLSLLSAFLLERRRVSEINKTPVVS